MRAYSICCAAVSADHRRDQQALRLHIPAGAGGEHLLEQNTLMRHVLVDDPQPVAPGRHDEAVVDLTERPQIAQGVQVVELR